VAQPGSLVDVRRGGLRTVQTAQEDCRQQQESQQEKQLTFTHDSTVELQVVRSDRATVQLSSPISMWLWIEVISFWSFKLSVLMGWDDETSTKLAGFHRDLENGN